MTGWGKSAFTPQRLALIGASAKEGKIGNLFLKNLLDGFPGEVVPIHPTAREILGRPAYPQIQDAPGPIDLALLALPAGACVEAMADCAEARVGVALVVSGGFAEIGKEGKALQDAMIEIARGAKIRVIGPNCFGLCNANLGLNASLGRGLPPRGGDISLVTQSGAYGMATFGLGLERRLSFAKVLSVGNKADLTDHEIVDYFASDKETRVLCLFLESVIGGRAFYESLKRATATKHVVIAKTGRSAAGRRAALSHTAALAGSHTAFVTAVRQAGAILAASGQEMLDIAEGLSRQPLPEGKRVGIVTASGGTGVELTDLCEAGGLSIPELGAATRKRIAQAITPHGGTANPIDVTMDWPRYPKSFSGSLKALFDDPGIDLVLPILLQRSALSRENVESVRDAVLQYRETHDSTKPVYACWVTERQGTTNQAILQEAGIPVYDWPERTAKAAAAIATYAAARQASSGASAPLPSPPAGARERAAVFLDVARREGRAVLLEHEVKGMVAAYGGAAPDERLVTTAREAREAAQALGGPVVLKIVSPEIVHKSDVGGVRLGVAADDAGAAFEEMTAKIGATHPKAQILGVSVQAMASGVETIIGGLRDADYGPLLLFGLGGVFVEVWKDVATRLLPADDTEIEGMVREIRGFPLLTGVRGGKAANLDALLATLRAAAWLMEDFAEITELDLNPVFAGPERAVIADGRAAIRNARD
jgi:acetyltransferase